jgi:hypothetical protein
MRPARSCGFFGAGFCESRPGLGKAEPRGTRGLTEGAHGVRIEVGYRIDLLAESIVLVEVKAVQKLLPIHLAQLLSYH